MQTTLLTMAAQVLSASLHSAQASEAGCKQKLDAVQAELDAAKGAAAAASSAVSSARAEATARKDGLGDYKRAVTQEEQAFKHLDAVDKSGKRVMADLEKSRWEASSLLAGTNEKGSAKAVVDFLLEAKADPALIAGVPSVLAKEPAERAGFDLLVLAHLHDLLGEKVASADAEIKGEAERQEDARAEMLGAFAVLDLALERVRDAGAELKEAEAFVQTCSEKLQEAHVAVQKEEDAFAAKLTEVATSEDFVGRCSTAIELLKKLAEGPDATHGGADVEMAADATNVVVA